MIFDADDYRYFYEELLTGERTEAEVSALVRLLGLDTPKKILDLACGFGRHTNRLAALVHSMTGLDLMAGFLEIACQDAIQRKVQVQCQLGDMCDINFKDEFDRVMLLFTAFGYFEARENLQILINARNAMKAGGLLIFDTINRDTLSKNFRPYYLMEKEGGLMIDRFLSIACREGYIINGLCFGMESERTNHILFICITRMKSRHRSNWQDWSCNISMEAGMRRNFLPMLTG